MKLFKLMTVAAICSLAIVGCNNKKTAEQENTEAEATVMTVDDVLESADSLTNDTITFEGICTHTCRHSGKKMFLRGSDDTKVLRVETAGRVDSFPKSIIQKVVKVKGILIEDRIDEASVQAMEKQYAEANAASHGENKEVGCETEKAAQGQKGIDTFGSRMKDYRDKIEARKQSEGKDYLSFYHVDVITFEPVEETAPAASPAK